MARSAQGSDEAFSAFVAARSPALWRYAFLLTGGAAQADDLLQASLVSVYLNWHRIEDSGAVEGYARTVMTRTHVSLWRRWRRREVPLAEPADVGAAPLWAAPSGGTRGASEVVERDAIWRLLNGLGPRQRAVVVLRFYEDLPEARIAEVLQCSVGTVKSQLSRALGNLRVALGESQDEPVQSGGRCGADEPGCAGLPSCPWRPGRAGERGPFDDRSTGRDTQDGPASGG